LGLFPQLKRKPDQKTDGEEGPAMRLSGKGLTDEQHAVVNLAIDDYFNPKSSEGLIISSA